MVENIIDNSFKIKITDESIQEYIETADRKNTLAFKENDKYFGFIAVEDIKEETCEISAVNKMLSECIICQYLV